MTAQLVAGVIVGVIGLVVALFLGAQWLRQLSRVGKLLAEREEFERACRRDAMEAAAAELQRVSVERDLHKRRGDEFFGIISGLEGEAEQWRDIFRKFLGQASTAQSWLLRELERATKIANARGAKLAELGHDIKNIDVDPELAAFLKKIQATAVPGNMPPGTKRAQEIQADHEAAQGNAAD